LFEIEFLQPAAHPARLDQIDAADDQLAQQNMGLVAANGNQSAVAIGFSARPQTRQQRRLRCRQQAQPFLAGDQRIHAFLRHQPAAIENGNAVADALHFVQQMT
jgi:hypothetical protein